jgi:hypothetical protein
MGTSSVDRDVLHSVPVYFAHAMALVAGRCAFWSCNSRKLLSATGKKFQEEAQPENFTKNQVNCKFGTGEPAGLEAQSQDHGHWKTSQSCLPPQLENPTNDFENMQHRRAMSNHTDHTPSMEQRMHFPCLAKKLVPNSWSALPLTLKRLCYRFHPKRTRRHAWLNNYPIHTGELLRHRCIGATT